MFGYHSSRNALGNTSVNVSGNATGEYLQDIFKYSQTISNDQCSNGSNVTKGYKIIESNIQNQELIKVTPPLNKVPSCEAQLTDIR